MAEGYNKPPPLQIKGNLSVDWKKWFSIFETYLLTANLDEADDKRKIALLLNLLEGGAQEIYDQFKWVEGAHKHVYAMVTKKFEEYCAPLKNLVVERFNFNSMTQGDGETFESFLSRLQAKASTYHLWNTRQGT